MISESSLSMKTNFNRRQVMKSPYKDKNIRHPEGMDQFGTHAELQWVQELINLQQTDYGHFFQCFSVCGCVCVICQFFFPPCVYVWDISSIFLSSDPASQFCHTHSHLCPLLIKLSCLSSPHQPQFVKCMHHANPTNVKSGRKHINILKMWRNAKDFALLVT